MNLMLNGNRKQMKDTGGELTIKSERGENGELLIGRSLTAVWGLPAEKGAPDFSMPSLQLKRQGLRHGPDHQPARSSNHTAVGCGPAQTPSKELRFYFTLPSETYDLKD